MKKITLLSAMAMLCLNFAVTAQQTATEIKPLKVGDKLPESFWQQKLKIINIELKQKTLKMSKYKGKALIIDFWGSWCGTCISRFPHINILSQKYNDDLSFLLVNTSSRDKDPAKVAEFVKKYLIDKKNFTVPFIYQNEVFNQLFFARALPHYVWIGKDGYIKGITDWIQVDKLNIERFIAGIELDLPIKTR